MKIDVGAARVIAAACLLSVSGVVGCGGSSRFDVQADIDRAMALRERYEAGGGGASSSVARSDPTGWATLKGRFRIVGNAPAPVPLNVTRDNSVCEPGGRKIMSDSIVVGSGGELANVLIYLNTEIPADNPLWEHPSYADTRASEQEFDQKQCIFLSHVFAMRATQTLKILNSDPIGHNTSIAPTRGANPFNQTIPANGAAFYEPGGASPTPFPVSCAIHPWMSAHMIIRDSPYFAVTKPDGTFEIANVPAGVELEFRVWHEMAGFPSGNFDGRKWNKGRFTVTLQDGQDVEMNVDLPADLF